MENQFDENRFRESFKQFYDHLDIRKDPEKNAQSANEFKLSTKLASMVIGKTFPGLEGEHTRALVDELDKVLKVQSIISFAIDAKYYQQTKEHYSDKINWGNWKLFFDNLANAVKVFAVSAAEKINKYRMGSNLDAMVKILSSDQFVDKMVVALENTKKTFEGLLTKDPASSSKSYRVEVVDEVSTMLGNIKPDHSEVKAKASNPRRKS